MKMIRDRRTAPRTRLSRRQFNSRIAAFSAAGAAALLPSRAAWARTDPLVVTWAGWDDPGLHQDYIAQFNSEPGFSFFADPSEAFQKAYAGFNADVYEISVTDTRRWRDAGLIQPIDPSRLTHWDDFYEPMKTLEGMWLDGELYYIPTMYGGVSILYRTDKVEIETESWAMLWDERYPGRIAPIDFPVENVVMIGLGLGMPNPWNMSDAELTQVRDVLEQQAELARFYWSNPTVAEQALVDGEIWIASAWSEMAPRVTGQGPIVYAAPKEGRLATQDGLAIAAAPEADLDRIYAYLNARTSLDNGLYSLSSFGMINPNGRVAEVGDLELLKSMGVDDIAATMKSANSWRTMEPEREEAYIQLSLEVRAAQ